MRALALGAVLVGCIPYVDFGPECLNTNTCPDAGDAARKDAATEAGIDAPDGFDAAPDAWEEPAAEGGADVAGEAGIDAESEAGADAAMEAAAEAAVDAEAGAEAAVDAPRELTCGAGLRACGGLCVNTLDDVSNCGACGRACRGDQACAGGACECAAGRVECGGACRNLQTDAAHCGRCANACASGSCVAGACACAAGEATCDGACRNLQTDAAHCGRCGNACRSGACATGACLAEQRSCRTAGTPGCGLVEVAGGTFTMGTAFACNPAAPLERPCGFGSSPALDRVTVGSIAIDAYEVTVARFNGFWIERARDGGASVRSTPVVYPGGRVVMWSGMGSAPSPQDATCNWIAASGARDSHPINCLTWVTAMEFCVWDGGRLPTEAEWEFVARGRAVPSEGLAPGREFPWGDEDSPRCVRAHSSGCTGEHGSFTRPVGRYGASGGVYDLAGNVAEWVADSYASYTDATCWGRSGLNNPLCQVSVGGSYVVPVRGGSWGGSDTRAASRVMPTEAGSRFGTTGFRCVRSR